MHSMTRWERAAKEYRICGLVVPVVIVFVVVATGHRPRLSRLGRHVM